MPLVFVAIRNTRRDAVGNNGDDGDEKSHEGKRHDGYEVGPVVLEVFT